MKRYFYLIFVIFLTLFIVACTDGGYESIFVKDNGSTHTEESISYKVDQVILSKGFQSIEPSVELIKKGLNIKLLISLGIIESSGVQIEKVTKIGNEINIHILNDEDNKQQQLVVPQIFLNLKGLKLRSIDNLKFNIVNENYTPIKVKFGINEIINKINSDFKVSSNSLPETSLSLEGEKIFWDIVYNSIFDRNNKETPLINLSLQVDANTGDVLKFRKSFISSYIDEGRILDYIDDKYIFYVKIEADLQGNNPREGLWFYDIESNERKLLYSTPFKISSVSLSPDLEYLAFIETIDNSSELYIVSISDKRIMKVSFDNLVDTKLVKWNMDNDLFAVDNTSQNGSVIYSYNILDNSVNVVAELDKDIIGLNIKGDNYIITETNNNKTNHRISRTSDWKEFRLLDFGLSPRYLNENKIVYLKKDEKKDRTILRIEDIEKHRNYDTIDMDLLNYHILPNGNITIMERNNGEFLLHEYNVKTKRTKFIAKINSNKAFYHKEKNLLYLDLLIPFENDKSQIIYSLDLPKLNPSKP